MIVRYLIDGDYVGRASRNPLDRGRLALLLGRFSSCLEENGRLISDKTGLIEKRLNQVLESLLADEAKLSGANYDNTVELRIVLESLTTILSDLSLCSMVDFPPGTQCTLQELMRFLSAARNLPDCVFTDTPATISCRSIVYMHLVDYFGNSANEVERMRRSWLRKQTFDNGTKECFRNYVAHFALGCGEFKIIDRMIGKGKTNYLESLARVVTVLANVEDTCFTIITARDAEMPPADLLAKFKVFLESLIGTLVLDRRIRKITVNFDLKKESTTDEFHDRFVLSTTHYFSIGRGADILKNNRYRLFNVYYCGKNDTSPKDIKVICDARSNEEQTPVDPIVFDAHDNQNKQLEVRLSITQPTTVCPPTPF